ncbi:hypothetical protein [Teredinibacter turnerae]|uniref:hypothetical protein n=1 Tax=Teredinibacter turnerae TaxID=2426 RepID=UPI00037DF91E|nr:hypothetical protein [Teredinibacter turnerae]
MTSAIETDIPRSVSSGKSWVPLWLTLVALLPIVAAYTVFFTGVGLPEHTVNSGRLLPQPVNVNALLTADAAEFMQAIAREKKWRLLLPVDSRCSDNLCTRNLYTTRQVHIRLGEKSDRLERVAINLEGTAGLDRLEQLREAHPRLKIVSVPAAQWQSWLRSAGVHENQLLDRAQLTSRYLLVDQEGYAMMEYAADIPGGALLKDLKRALKFSIDYQQ